MAGADSTSILLRSIFYYMMKNPSTMTKAVAEVDEAFDSGKLSWPPKHHEVVASLPYILAVIKEASRYFPAFSVQMPRCSPPEGITLAGKFIPPGYAIGFNPHVVHMDKGVFGQDADVFRPERWLESEEQCKIMDRAYMSFGMGVRPCVGKNVSWFEAYTMLCCRLLIGGYRSRLLRSTSLCRRYCAPSLWRWPMIGRGRHTMPASSYRRM